MYVGGVVASLLEEERRQQLRPQTTNTGVLGPKVPQTSQDFPTLYPIISSAGFYKEGKVGLV